MTLQQSHRSQHSVRPERDNIRILYVELATLRTFYFGQCSFDRQVRYYSVVELRVDGCELAESQTSEYKHMYVTED